MTNSGHDNGGPVFTAAKDGTTLRLSRDPHPEADAYVVIETPGLLVLFPQSKPDAAREPMSEPEPIEPMDRDTSDHDEQLRAAFRVLGSRVAPSTWSGAANPQRLLEEGFDALARQPDVRDDVRAYLDANPSVGSAAQMLFTSIAMSARADWRAVPTEFRGVAARGWFLGRWLPTFLVLDGPILQFLNGPAFRRQEGFADFLRAVRSFFHARDFMALRHAFAHWSFAWAVTAENSEIVAVHKSTSKEFRVSRKEADAFHILTFAVVEAVHRAFIRQSPSPRPPTQVCTGRVPG